MYEAKLVNTQHIKNLRDKFLTDGPYVGKVDTLSKIAPQIF